MRYIIPALFFCFLSFSQTNDTIYNKAKNLSVFSFKPDLLSKFKPNLNYKFKATTIPVLSVYNRNTKLNDIYYLPKDSIYATKSVVFNTYQFIKQDSFNPYGANNLGTGLIMGAINTVFKYNFKL
ncbi:hypothetical protein [Flavobacterium sp. WC2509]|uniref:hypothetical protein n=1 Tax=Flavobacterium sp. WC2509 TaxID=3461406 RepID=UPI004043CAE3